MSLKMVFVFIASLGLMLTAISPIFPNQGKDTALFRPREFKFAEFRDSYVVSFFSSLASES